jgi:hypothetical protein
MPLVTSWPDPNTAAVAGFAREDVEAVAHAVLVAAVAADDGGAEEVTDETGEPIERWLHEGETGGRVQFPYLDEFIARNVDIHFETMSDTTFWIGVRCRETGREWNLNCGAINSRAKGYSMVELA